MMEMMYFPIYSLRFMPEDIKSMFAFKVLGPPPGKILVFPPESTISIHIHKKCSANRYKTEHQILVPVYSIKDFRIYCFPEFI